MPGCGWYACHGAGGGAGGAPIGPPGIGGMPGCGGIMGGFGPPGGIGIISRYPWSAASNACWFSCA